VNPSASDGSAHTARPGAFETVTASGLEHAGRAAIAMCTRSRHAGLGCAGRSADALAEQLRAVSERAGLPVRVIGHSRGGQFARVAARRALDRHQVEVAALVTLGAPFDLYGLRWSLLAQAAALSIAGSLGAPGLATLGCLRGRCCAAFRDGLRAPWPSEVPFTSIYARGDRAVPARASIDR